MQFWNILTNYGILWIFLRDLLILCPLQELYDSWLEKKEKLIERLVDRKIDIPLPESVLRIRRKHILAPTRYITNWSFYPEREIEIPRCGIETAQQDGLGGGGEGRTNFHKKNYRVKKCEEHDKMKGKFLWRIERKKNLKIFNYLWHFTENSYVYVYQLI